MAKYLVRHAKAGQRRDWDSDDELRPLSNAGWRQAGVLADRLSPVTSGPLLSSPYLRCRQTLEPLGRQLGCEITDDIRLREGEPFEPALDLFIHAAEGSVLCSHGDLIPEIISALVRRGALLSTLPDWRKGVVWHWAHPQGHQLDGSHGLGVLTAWEPPEG